MAIPTVSAVNPYDIPKSMTREQLEYWILFGICVANKPAKITEQKIQKFLALAGGETPFKSVRRLMAAGELSSAVKDARFGQYGRITEAFRQAVDLDLDKISVEALESVKGIGPKTARMIMLYYDPKADCVPLDTHVLKFLNKRGYARIPKSTPPAGPKYRELEQLFQHEALKAGKTVRELDTEVWLSYAKI